MIGKRVTLAKRITCGMVILLSANAPLFAGPQTTDSTTRPRNPEAPVTEPGQLPEQDLPPTPPGIPENVPDPITNTPTTAIDSTATTLPTMSFQQRFDQWIQGPGLTGDWLGYRRQLINDGILVQASLTGILGKNLAGGLSTHQSGFANVLTASVTLDTDRLFDWPGGKAYIELFNRAGTDFNQEMVGSFARVQRYDLPKAVFAISELWYQQELFNNLDNQLGLYRLKAGKADVNNDFVYSTYFDGFNNQSFGMGPVFGPGVPTFPNQATFFAGFVRPIESFYAGLGFYDGGGKPGNDLISRGPGSFFIRGKYFLIGELSWSWHYMIGDYGGAGRVVAGGYGYTGGFEVWDKQGNSSFQGAYVMAEQTIWSPTGNTAIGRGLGVVAQYVRGAPQVSPISDQYVLAARWAGPWEFRDEDVIGAGISVAHLTSAPGSPFDHAYEVTLETFYRLQITQWFSLQPDLQYIIHPGGNQPNSFMCQLIGRIDF